MVTSVRQLVGRRRVKLLEHLSNASDTGSLSVVGVFACHRLVEEAPPKTTIESTSGGLQTAAAADHRPGRLSRSDFESVDVLE